GEFPLLRGRQDVAAAIFLAEPGAEGVDISWRDEHNGVPVRRREYRMTPDMFGPSFGLPLLVVDFPPLAVGFILGPVARRLDKSAELLDGDFVRAKVERFGDGRFLRRSFAANAGLGPVVSNLLETRNLLGRTAHEEIPRRNQPQLHADGVGDL